MVDFLYIKDYMFNHFEDENGQGLTTDSWELSEDDHVIITNEYVSVRGKLPGGKIQVPLSLAQGSLIMDGRVSSLENTPTRVDGDFDCRECGLTSLQGGPEFVGSDYDCGSNNLTSLIHGPKHVGNEFTCDSNLLEDLTNAPKCRILYARGNPLKTLKGVPDHVGKLIITVTPDLPLLELVNWSRPLELYAPISANQLKDLELIVNKYMGQGKSMVLNFALELKQAGYAGNARW